MLDTVLLHLIDDFSIYYGPNAILPVSSLAKYWWRFDPTLDIMALLPQESHEAFVNFFIVFCLIAFAVTIGFLTPYTVPLSFLMLLSMHRQCPFNINGGDAMMLLSLFLLSFGRSGDALSLDNLVRSFRQDWRHTGFAAQPSPAWPLRMLQLQLVLTYFDTFLWKFTGSKWLDGSAVYWATRMHEFIRFPLPIFLDNAFCMRALSWSTLVIEFSLCTLIWFRETRYAVLLMGLCLHLGIDIFINLPVFEWVFISMLVLFVYPDDLAKAAAFVRRLIAERLGPARILTFDGHCLLCIRATGVLHRLDIFRRVEFVAFTDDGNRSKLEGFNYERAQNEMLLESHKGWIGGFRAFRAIAASLPLLWPIVPLLHLPGMTALGDAAYRAIARNRYLLLGRCEDGFCRLHGDGEEEKGAEHQ